MIRPITWLVALCVADLLLSASWAAAQPAWKVGDLWDLQVEVPGKKEHIVHVTVSGTELVDGAVCWQLLFFPGSSEAAKSASPRHRVVLDKKSGQPVRVLRLTDKQAVSVEKAGTAAFVTGLPQGVPLEWFAGSDAPLGRTALAGTNRFVEVRKQPAGRNYTLEMALFDGDEEQWSVRQLWMPGEPWWHTYERRVKGVVELSARRLNVPPLNDDAKIAAAKKSKHFVNLHPLAGDFKLRVYIELNKEAGLSELLLRMERATGRKITLADNLKYHHPDFKSVTAPRMLATYSIMEILAIIDLDDGRWTRTDDGYVLEGESRSIRLPRPVWPWVVAGAALLVSAAAGVVWRRRRAKVSSAK